jgi:hypothetical protein
MNRNVCRPLASWRASDRRALRPELWVVALVAVGMLLVEVWQSSRMAELCLALDHNRGEVQQAQARLEYLRAQVDRRTTRAELAPQASLLGLAPVDARQLVQLPPEYLAAADRQTGQDSRPMLAWMEGVSRVLVPEATARDRAHTNGRTNEP